MIVDRERVEKALPGYTVAERLGSGAFGLVLAGEYRQLGRPVAIKVMEAESSDGAAVAGGFATEARVLAGLDHPHVLRAYDYVEAEGLCLVVMELLAGGTLTRRRVGMGPEQACAVGLAVAAALGHAHGHGVLHRDIKADNILFSADGTPKVSDFGIAKLFEGSAATASRMVGTPMYMAPEQIQGGRLGPRTDLYALGAVLYRLLSGRAPFEPKQPLQVLWNQQLTEAPPPMTGVAPELAAVVLRALAKAPTDRHPDAAAFGLDLAHAATRVFGPDWTVRAGLPLHLDDAVRRAADGTVNVTAPPNVTAPATANITAPGNVTAPVGAPVTPATPSSAGPEAPQGWDFFISYSRTDQAWADWIAGELEAAGHRVLVQAWDDLPSSHWTTRMSEGVEHATRTLAILSPAYQESVFGQAEWQAAYDADPQGFVRKLIPVRVVDCPRPDLLGEAVSIDLFGHCADTARRSLLAETTVAVDARTTRPASLDLPVAQGSTTVAAPGAAPGTESASLVPPQRPPTSSAPAFPRSVAAGPQDEPASASATGAGPTGGPAGGPAAEPGPAPDPPAGPDPDPGPGPGPDDGADMGKPRHTVARRASVCAVAVAALAVAIGVFAPGVPPGDDQATAKYGGGPAASAGPQGTATTTATGTAQPSLAPATAGSQTPAASSSSQDLAPSAGQQTPAASLGTPPTAPTAAAPIAAGPPSTSDQPEAPAGPGSDPDYLSGSEVSVPGCTGWMDFSGTLYGTLSAGDASCAAEVVTTDEAYGAAPSSASLTAANYTNANSKPRSFFYVGYYKFSTRICIWNQNDPGRKQCSPTYVNTQGSVARR